MLDERILNTDTRGVAPQTPAAGSEPDANRNDTTANGNNNNNNNNADLRFQQQHHNPSPAASTSSHQPSAPPQPHGLPVSAGDVYAHPPQGSPPTFHQHDYTHGIDGPQGDDLGPPRKRRRPALSCEPCRRRKVRCDRVHPCGPCVRMGVSSTCEYDNRFPRPGLLPGAAEFLATPGTPTYQRQKNDHQDPAPRGYEDFEAQVRTHASGASTSNAGLDHPGNGALVVNASAYPSPDLANGQASYTNTLQRDIRELQSRLARVEQLSSKANGTASRHDPELQRSIQALTARVESLERHNPSSTETSDVPYSTRLTVPVVPPRIKMPVLGENTTKFWGPTHYMHLFDPKSDLFGRMLCTNPKFNLTQVVPSSLAVDGFQHCRNLRQAVKARNKVTKVDSPRDILHTLPHSRLRDELIEHYFRTLEELYGIFHAPSFRKQYALHRDDLQHAPEVLLAQVLLMFAIGSVFLAEPDRSSLRPQVLRWVYSAQAWLTGPLEKTHGGDEWQRCWCLLILARQANSVGTKEQTHALAGTMVHSAFTIGLHRDGEHFSGLSPFRIEMRRRLWSTVLMLSLSASADASMPPMVSTRDFDCKSPLGVSDDRMDEQSGSMSVQDSSEPSVRSLLRDSYAIRREVQDMLNDYHAPMQYDRLIKLSSNIDTSLTKINTFFGKQSSSRPTTAPTRLHQILLLMFNHSAQLDLHAAFLVAAKKDHRFHFSRHRALDSAMALLASLGNLDHHHPALDDISKLTLVGTGVFKSSLSMKAIAVVCQELNLQLSEVQTSFSASSREPLFRTLRQVQEQSLNLVKSGDPSCKRYAYLSVTIPMIESRQAGRPADDAIPHALSECLRICTDVMTSQLSPEQVPAKPKSSEGGVEKAEQATSDGKPLDDLSQFENMDFSFDPSWLLTAWHFGNGMS